MTSLKTLLKDNTVSFSRYRKGFLYYRIVDFSALTSDQFGDDFKGSILPHIPAYEFPVPIEDIGDATFSATEKAILFMRYIRKAQEEGSFVRV